jgi:hypothetical protein
MRSVPAPEKQFLVIDQTEWRQTMNLFERCQQLLTKFEGAPARDFLRIAITPDHTDKPPGVPFSQHQHYFVVRVNEMFLALQRQWFRTFLPMVTVISEFHYGKSPQVVPFVVGPSLMEKDGLKLPDTSLIITNTRVAGVHPYRGGRLNLSVVLYQLQTSDAARKLLEVVESAAGAFDFATALGTYTKMADVVLDGIEKVFDMSPVQPVLGWRNEFDPDANDIFKPGYFAVVDTTETKHHAAQFSVKDDKLLYQGRPFRDTDYLLYSITQNDKRGDYASLPFHEQWDKVRTEASQPTEDGWKAAKATMVVLYQNLVSSPDLTDPQARTLADEYVNMMKGLHDQAVEISKMAGPVTTAEKPERTPLQQGHRRALAVLDL